MTDPDSPWNTWMISAESSFTCAGSSARNSGRKPPTSVLMSSAGRVWDSGINDPAGRGGAEGPAGFDNETNRPPMRFL